MVWSVVFLPEIEDDLASLGRAEARRALKVIEDRIENGEPEKAGRPLRKDLTGYRRIRTGDIRIVYRVNKSEVEVLVIAVGARRDNEVYELAGRRV